MASRQRYVDAVKPEAVLLDSGGVFVLPDPDRVLGALERAECGPVARELLVDAHYRAASRFTTDLDVEGDWAGCWLGYLESYLEACGVDAAVRTEAHRHLDSEFADAALWIEPAPGAREGLIALAETGVRLGIVSNADGLMGRRLAELDVCQVGPGVAVAVECVIDSGDVGIMKPDPRIFHAALDVMGVVAAHTWYVGDMPAIDVVGARRADLRPFLIDPLHLHDAADYDNVESLGELAGLIRGGS